MSSNTYSRADLMEMLTHVQYELDMLFETSLALADGHEWVIQNALVESFVVHARSLDEFFFKEDRRNPRNRVTAEDYVHSSCAQKPDRPEVLENLWNQVSIRVAHLLTERLETDPESTYWKIQEIRDALLEVATGWAEDAKRDSFVIAIPKVVPVLNPTKVMT